MTMHACFGAHAPVFYQGSGEDPYVTLTSFAIILHTYLSTYSCMKIRTLFVHFGIMNTSFLLPPTTYIVCFLTRISTESGTWQCTRIGHSFHLACPKEECPTPQEFQKIDKS
jgi:hypothetical protein